MTTRRKSRKPRAEANRLWKYRRRMGFTQRQAALILGHVSPTLISHYERGDQLPSLATALKLEIIYRVPVAFLFPDLYARLKATLREREEQLRNESDHDATAKAEER